MRGRYPLLAEWIEADRCDADLGARVAAWLVDYRKDRSTGPTWHAVAEFVRPDLALVPDAARRWYASQLVNRLARQEWLAVAEAPSGAGHLDLGPRALGQDVSPLPDDDQDGPGWLPGRLF